MDWLPLPADFRADLAAAVASADPAERLARLRQLARHRLDMLQTIQLDQALTEALKDPVTAAPQLKLALLGTATLDHLGPGIRVAGQRRGLTLQLYTGAFGQYRQELLDPAAGLQAFEPDYILLSLDAREAVAGIPVDATADETGARLQDTIAELRTLWRIARERLGATVIQQTVLDTTESLFGSHDRLVAASPTRLVSDFNRALADAASEDGVLLFDLGRQVARDGLASWFDIGQWLHAKMLITPARAPHFGEWLARIIAAHRGQTSKCLVLDLDNTLWGGVIGDDGLEGIVLGEGSARGEAHLALQRYARQLRERGVILAVCSRNDPDIALAAFRDHPEMLLRPDDIAAFVANWGDKAENLKMIAERLNIGLDSLVFVDDNPVERARIRQALPMVAVPELPADPARYVRCIADGGWFEAVGFTPEDRDRSRQYAANAEREALRDQTASIDEFLRGLQMSVAWGPVTAVDMARVVQLLNKTNQFNTTTRRYSREELDALLAAEGSLALQFRLIDRFGDNGIVSVMLLAPAPGQPAVAEILNWVMSCRVFGRQLEQEAMNIAVETAAANGFRALTARFVPTAKNGVIRNLYPELGFVPAAGAASDDGASHWRLRLADYRPHATFIERTTATQDTGT